MSVRRIFNMADPEGSFLCDACLAKSFESAVVPFPARGVDVDDLCERCAGKFEEWEAKIWYADDEGFMGYIRR